MYTIAFSYLIKLWREILIVVFAISLIGMLMHTDSLKRNYEKKLSDKDVAYISLKNDMSAKLLEEQNNSIRKVNELNKEYLKLQEKHKHDIEEISASRDLLDSDLSRLLNQADKLGSRSSSTEDSNTKTSDSVQGRELQGLRDSFKMCATEYADMGEEADRLANSVEILTEAWKELEQKYNTE